MARKGENIYKRKDNRWEARISIGYTVEGKRKYHSVYGKSYQEAKKKKQEYLVMQRENPPEEYRPKPMELLFENYVSQWLEWKKHQIKDSTYCTYVRLIKAQILPGLGKMTLQQLTREKIKHFFAERAVNGRCDGKGGLSSKTISDIYILLNSIFDYIEGHYQYENPIKNLKISGINRVSVDPLNEMEYRALTLYLLELNTTEALGVLSSLYMGLRLGEICALRWKDIDLESRIFRIRHTIYRVLAENSGKKTALTISSPKTLASVRDIPIPEFMYPLLKEKMSSPEDYLLTGSPFYIDPRTYQNHFKRILRDCGMRNITYHCLRHTFATNCVILNFDIKTLSEILGHANTSITLNRYVHSSLHQKQRQMQKLSNLFL